MNTETMNRRDFLLLRPNRDTHSMTLSCEWLYMRFVDAELEDAVPSLFEELARELRVATTVQVTDTAWLARAELKRGLDAVLDAFRASGGRVDIASTK